MGLLALVLLTSSFAIGGPAALARSGERSGSTRPADDSAPLEPRGAILRPDRRRRRAGIRPSVHEVVTDDAQEAVAAAEHGERVVLICRADSTGLPVRPGRLAVLVGDPADPAVQEAAVRMEAELYGRGG